MLKTFVSPSFDVRRFVLCIELFFTLLFACYITISNGSAMSEYARSEQALKSFCSSHRADNSEPTCQSFWFRTLNDPSIAWNFYYTSLTAILVIASATTIFITLRGFASQREETQRLFVLDQRPWLKVVINPIQDNISFNDNHDLNMRLSILVANIGKTPAIHVAHSQFISTHTRLPGAGATEFFHSLKAQAKQLMLVGKTLLPGDENRSETSITISKATIESTWQGGDIFAHHLLMYCVCYSDVFDISRIYEANFCHSLTFLGALAPIPRNHKEMQSLRGRPELTAMYLTKIT